MNELKACFTGLLLIFIMLGVDSVKPKIEFNSTVDVLHCKSLGNACNANHECCTLRCHKLNSSGSGICEQLIISISPENDTITVTTSSNSSSTNTEIPCKQLGYDSCKSNITCCTGFCSIPLGMTLGVCRSIPWQYHENLEFDDPKTILEDIRNECRPFGSNLCESHSECCTEYCEKQNVDWDFGVCEQPITDIPFNGLDGFYEKGTCVAYGGIKTTVTGERFNASLMTAAHRTLPFKSLIRVVVDDGERQVAVRINDRKVSRNREILQLSAAAAQVLGISSGAMVPCNLIILTEDNCTPSMADSCVYDQECCSQTCHQEFPNKPGFCAPDSVQYNWTDE